MDLVYPSSTPSIGSSRSFWKLQFISLTLVALATATSIVGIAMSVSFWQRSRSLTDEGHKLEGQGPRTTGSSVVCLPCSAILDASSSLDERIKSEIFSAGHGFDSTDGNGGDLSSGDEDTCCAKGKHKLRLLLTMFLIVRARKDRDRRTTERTRCLVFPSIENSTNGTRCIVDKRQPAEAAHLTGAGSGPTTGFVPSNHGSRRVGLLVWANSGVLQGHLENSNGRLTCRSGGFYFVYSQVYFVEYEDGAKTTEVAVSVYINKFVNLTGTAEVLAQRSEALCPRLTLAAESLCEYAVYAGSLVELAPGDSVYVTVSHPTFVNYDSKVTYFGLQKVT